MFPKFSQRQSANIATGDETWGHYLEPGRKIGNKIWLNQHNRRSAVAKRTISTRGFL
jgi:hypothetical protein